MTEFIWYNFDIPVTYKPFSLLLSICHYLATIGVISKGGANNDNNKKLAVELLLYRNSFYELIKYK